jgi:hypothetical protein
MTKSWSDAISYGDSIKIASLELAYQNQILLTMCCQDPNQLFKGVLCAASAADLTPGAATKGDWHARFAD